MTTAKATPTEPTPPPAAHVNLTARMIAVDHISESPTNPRRTYDPQKMKELTDSIRAEGVQQPVVVRMRHSTKADRYELVVGSRRLRATKAAGLAEIPCVVRELSDLAVVKIQLIENSQREDVHPLEEGHGYVQLMKLGSYTAEMIAAETGKDVTYVYRRIKLLELTPPLQQLFLDNKILLAHALPLSRLSKPDQEWAHKNCLLKEDEFRVDNNWVKKASVVTPHDLNLKIEQHLLRPLAGAIWQLDDADLVKKAGACLTCPKRSSAQSALFDAGLTKGDRCLDAHCYEAKRTAFIERKIAEAKTAGVKLLRGTSEWTSGQDDKKYRIEVAKHQMRNVVKEGACDHVERAIIVHGDNLGSIVLFCRTETCKVHSGLRNQSRPVVKSFADTWKTKRENLALKIDNEVRRETVRQIAAKARKDGDQLGAIELGFARLLDRLDHDTQRELCTTLGLEPTKVKNSWGSGTRTAFDAPVAAKFKAADAKARIELLVTAALVHTPTPTYYRGKRGLPEVVTAAAKTFRVKTDAIAKKIADPLLATFADQQKRAKKKHEAEKGAKRSAAAKAILKAKSPHLTVEPKKARAKKGAAK